MASLTKRNDDSISTRALWTLGVALAALAVALFWAVWRSQFTASPGYLFDTPTRAVEAGYCLGVATDVVPGGAPIGSYFDEAARFWVSRLREEARGDLARAIAEGRARLMEDRTAARDKADAWLRFAMDRCSDRAVTYGAHFRSFE